ncbi:MAG: NAD-dependent deacylase [Bacteroidia bacterium]
MKKVVILTGAGISAESGVPTFRDSDGLWEGHDVMEVASPQGWAKNQELVLDFYNQRRRNIGTVQPNAAHIALAKLEEKFDVTVITQNIDNLHERGGSGNVLHLHGEITKVSSCDYPDLVYDIGTKDICVGDTCERGSQLRPFVVWFGEPVPKIEEAMEISAAADIFIVVGTSMAVYPAAGLIGYVPNEARKFVIDRVTPSIGHYPNLEVLEGKASEKVPMLVKQLLAEERG